MIARKLQSQRAAFTLVELLVAAAVAALLGTAVMTTWSALATTAVNTSAYADRQNEQLRVLDYLKRDIRRANSVAVYDAGNPVIGNNWGTELRLTLPDYYADARDDDNAIGTRVVNTPALNSGAVSYGAPMTVRYFITAGAVRREEAGVIRSVGAAQGGFTFSFRQEANGAVRCRVFYDQPLRGTGQIRQLRRQLEALCSSRAQLRI